MKKRILSILLVCCMVLTMLPTAAFAAGGAVRPAATQYTYTLHYDANGGSGAPPSQSVTSTEFHVWVPISEIIPTRDGYTFMGWANSRTGKPIYGGNGGYTECLVVHGRDMSTTIYAIWEAHDHSWGEWTSNGNGTHTRTCATDSSHTETGSCSGSKATFTERAVCETCHTAYGELLQITKTVITTPPTLPAEGYVGNEYMDEALSGGEAKAEGTGVVVPGSFRFKQKGGGRVVRPGENRMEVLFTPDDTEAYTTAECIVTVTGIKRTITRVPEDVVITDKPLGTPFEDLGLPLSPYGVMVETNTGASFSPIPVTWDGSTYDPNIYGEQIITGELHVEQSRYTDKLEPTSTVKATARITLIDDRVFTPTLEPPTYSKQLYGGDLCFHVFSDKYLSGGTATANGERVSGKFTLDKDQKIYGHSLTASTLLQAGPLQLKVIFTPDNPKRYTKAECPVDVNVNPRKFISSDIVHIPNKKIGTTFEELNLSDSFDFYAVGDENDPEGTGSGYDMPVVTSWDSSTYDPNSFDEQTIYGEVNRAEFEKYYIVPEGADLRGVVKITLQADPVETEITQTPVFQWKNGDFTLPDNTIFTWRRLQVKPYNDEVGTLVGGVVKVKGTDTVAPGTFSFKNAPPFYLRTPGEHDVTVVFTPDDLRLHKPTEITIKINAIKNTIRNIDEPDPITDKPFGTPFAELGLPENVCINAVDGAWRWVDVAWDESSYDAESVDWQTITGTPVLSNDDGDIFQQPEPAVTTTIRVKLFVPDSAPTITVKSLPNGTVGAAYSQRLTTKGTAPIRWSIVSGALPEGLKFNESTGEISGAPVREETAAFTVKAVNALGSDTKELSITIAKAEFTVTFDGNGGTPFVGSMTTIDQKLSSLPSASRRGSYRFLGWYLADGAEITTDTVFSANTTVYAHWTYTGGSGSVSTSYTITIRDSRDGNVTANRRSAPAGATVTITITPDSGYVLENISVTDKNGNDLKLTDKGNGKYIFTMPGSKVEIKVTFMEDNSVLNFFYDVPNDAYYYEAVKWAVENGITGGVGNSLFAPNQPCTRAQIVTFLWRAAGSPVVNYLMPFTDVDEGAYYAEAVRWAASTGIVTGLTETTFGTDSVCTRAQAAAMIYRCAQAQGKGFTGAWMFHLPFTDVPEWAYESVAWCYMNGVTTGVSETSFAPGNDCTRAQIVTFLWRAFGK